MKDFTSIYKSKLTTAEIAVGRINSGVTLSMGMAMTEPPALLKALADRTSAGKVDDLKVYYCESTRIAGDTILRYELTDRIHPYCMFISGVERDLIKQGEQDSGRKVVSYANNAEHWPADLRSPANWLSTSLKPSTVWVLGAVASAS